MKFVFYNSLNFKLIIRMMLLKLFYFWDLKNLIVFGLLFILTWEIYNQYRVGFKSNSHDNYEFKIEPSTLENELISYYIMSPTIIFIINFNHFRAVTKMLAP